MYDNDINFSIQYKLKLKKLLAFDFIIFVIEFQHYFNVFLFISIFNKIMHRKIFSCFIKWFCVQQQCGRCNKIQIETNLHFFYFSLSSISCFLVKSKYIINNQCASARGFIVRNEPFFFSAFNRKTCKLAN